MTMITIHEYSKKHNVVEADNGKVFIRTLINRNNLLGGLMKVQLKLWYKTAVKYLADSFSTK